MVEEQTASELALLVDRHLRAMTRIASFRGAKRQDVDRAILESVRAAAAAEPPERDQTLFRTLIGRVAALERQTPRPEDWEAEPEPALRATALERLGSRWEGWFKVDPHSLKTLERRRPTEARRSAAAAVARLPLAQRVVVVLRDVAGWSAEAVERLLGIEAADQRILLHGGRSRVRLALESSAKVL